MKQIQSGQVIFNSTPHAITFWDTATIVIVPPDTVINAQVEEQETGKVLYSPNGSVTGFVKTAFVPTEEGRETIRSVRESEGGDAVIIVGSIIAAQAYPGEVVAMTPAVGFERVPPAEKRANPFRFTVF
jgi:hypothetical protein